MRTTLTIDEAVAERIQRLVSVRKASMKDVVNEALREGLRAMEHAPAERRRRFVVESQDFGVRAGIDLDTIGRFADELEDESIAVRL